MSLDAAAQYEEQEQRPLQRWEFVFLAAFWFSIAGAACWQSTKEYFDNDELCTALLVSTPSFTEMWNVIRHGGELNPPLFFIVEWVIARIGGVGEMALRSLSFLSVAFAGWVLYFTIRPVTGPRAAALSISLILGLSRLGFYFAGRARYYGLFLLLTTLALWFAMRLGSRRELRWSDCLRVFLVHCSLVYLHLFGLLFSGVILLGSLASDVFTRKYRWRLHGPVIAAWIAFGAWIPIMMRQVKSAGTYTPPGYHTIGWIVEQISLETPLALILLLIAFVAGVGMITSRPTPATEEAISSASGTDTLALLLLAGGLLSVPLATWFGSFFITALFMPRYVFPSIAGWAILIALVILALFRFPRQQLHLKWALPVRAWSVTWGAVLVFALGFQPMRAWKNAPRPAAAYVDNDYGYKDLPIVFENSWPYLKRAIYGKGREYLLLTDLNASRADSDWYTGFVEGYFRSYYPRFPKTPARLPGAHVAHPNDLPEKFLAVDDDAARTFEWLFKTAPELKTRLLGTKKADIEIFGNERVYLVERSTTAGIPK